METEALEGTPKEDEKEDEPDTSELFGSFFEMKLESSSLMVKPAKAKNQEFNIKNASPDELLGFEASDA